MSKSFDGFKAVDNISFSIKEGEIIGILGPNGAGKSTTIFMLLDLISPDTGDILVFGKSFSLDREAILSQVGFTSPYVALPFRLTVFENLLFFAKMYNVQDSKKKIMYLLNLFKIEYLKNKPVGYLSSGEATRVGLCKSLINTPKLLLLDEPTSSLDPDISLTVRQVLLNFQKENNSTIIYTSHNMHEVEKICQKIIFLSQGKIIAHGTPIEVTNKILKSKSNKSSLEDVFLEVAKGKKYEAK